MSEVRPSKSNRGDDSAVNHRNSKPMKTPHIINRCAILAIAIGFAISSPIRAETREVITRGTVQTFEPKSFVILSDAAPEPLTYSAGTNIKFVDEAGVVVAPEVITPGMPVTVYYMRDGDKLIANRVIVHKVTTTTTEPGRALTKKEAKNLREAQEHPEREARRAADRGKPFPPPDPSKSTTITTTTSDGTIASLTPDTIVMTRTTREGPITYRYSKTTEYVDETGAPMTMEMVKTGVPVTVTYVREGDRLIAQRVIVHSRPLVRP